MLNIARAALIVILAALGCGQQRQAVFVTADDGGVNVLDERGQLIRTVKTDTPLNGTLSVDQHVRYGVRIQGECHGELAGSLQEVDLLAGTLKPVALAKLLPHQPPPGEFEVYQDPSVSPSGRYVAFIVRPCNAAHKLDAVEGAGFAAVWDRQTSKARLLQGSIGEVGGAFGFAMNPTWSDDERYLFVNYETGFRVLQASDGSVVGADLPPHADASWSSALGWIGSGCIAYLQGMDFQIAEASPRMVVNVRSRRTTTLANVVGYNSDVKPTTVRWPFMVSRIGDQIEILSFMMHKPIVRKMMNGSNGIQVLPNAGQVPLPPFCR